MTATLIQNQDCVVLRSISWQTYQSLLRDFEHEPAVRLTYCNGDLEIRMPRDPHESIKKLLGRMVEALTEELELEVRSLGSRTCDREDLAKGLEPDQCYYIQHEAEVRNLEQIDLNLSPPPDLTIEVDVTSSSMNRMAIYASLGVPEIWRYRRETLTFLKLAGSEYEQIVESLALPGVKAADLEHWLKLRSGLGETSWIRQFRQWIRDWSNPS